MSSYDCYGESEMGYYDYRRISNEIMARLKGNPDGFTNADFYRN